jgi:hypothetical protein
LSIVNSSRKDIDNLISDLSSGRATARESAVARLIVIGARAVERLIGVAADGGAAPAARISALHALEAIADRRALAPALDVIADQDPDVAAAAVGVARVFLRGARGVAVVDRLTAAALDRARPVAIRIAAITALGDLTSATLEPLFTALGADPHPAIAALAGRPSRRPAPTLEAVDDPAALRRAISHGAGRTPLSAMQRLVEHIREREQSETGTRRTEWMAARAAAHAALAGRGSRIALYDLRETVEAADVPLPVEFLTALTSIGDASCLGAIATAYAKALAAPRGDDWWRRHLRDAFRSIVKREKITRRNAVMKKIEKRWPAILTA